MKRGSNVLASFMLSFVLPVLLIVLFTGCTQRTVDRGRLTQQEGTSYLGKTPFTGTTISRNSEGVVLERLTWRNGKPDGPFVRYYEHGVRKEVGAYRAGKREGEFTRYSFSGEVWGWGFWKAGRRHGPFEEYFDNGLLDEKGTYVEGEVDGPYEQYDRDGNLLRRGRYVGGSFVKEE